MCLAAAVAGSSHRKAERTMADEEKTDYFTCGIVQKYVDVAPEFTRDLSGELLGPMWALFLALAGLWIVIQGLRLMIAHTSWADIVKQSLFVALAGFPARRPGARSGGPRVQCVA